MGWVVRIQLSVHYVVIHISYLNAFVKFHEIAISFFSSKVKNVTEYFGGFSRQEKAGSIKVVKQL